MAAWLTAITLVLQILWFLIQKISGWTDAQKAASVDILKGGIDGIKNKDVSAINMCFDRIHHL